MQKITEVLKSEQTIAALLISSVSVCCIWFLFPKLVIFGVCFLLLCVWYLPELPSKLRSLRPCYNRTTYPSTYRQAPHTTPCPLTHMHYFDSFCC